MFSSKGSKYPESGQGTQTSQQQAPNNLLWEGTTSVSIHFPTTPTCTAPIIIRKIQINTTVDGRLTVPRPTVTIKRTMDSNAGVVRKKGMGNHHTLSLGWYSSRPLWKGVEGLLKKTTDSTTTREGNFSAGWISESHPHKGLYTKHLVVSPWH